MGHLSTGHSSFAQDSVKRTVGPQLLKGEKWSALSISEPFAGSDVAAVRATAKKTPDGKFYIVNGIKKWITEGLYADYFVTAVRTGGKGAKALSLLLVERGEGIETKQIKTTYSTCCGTCMVLMKDVKVPVENLMGKEGDGFMQIMFNFNHERWMIAQSLIGQGRAALADTFMWAKQRKIFGKSLIDQPVIRNKLAQAAAELESVHAFMESITYDMCRIGTHNERLAGPIAMLKFQATRSSWKIADDCVQIFGGRESLALAWERRSRASRTTSSTQQSTAEAKRSWLIYPSRWPSSTTLLRLSSEHQSKTIIFLHCCADREFSKFRVAVV